MRMLSLFTGCGGMDIGFHGGFTTRRAFLPADPSGMVCDGLGEGWVRVASTRFRTVFANDIRLAAKIVYMQNCTDSDFQERCYRTESVLDLVRAHLRGDSVFPDNIDLVIGGFPCQDFSTAGKRMGLASAVSHRGDHATGRERFLVSASEAYRLIGNAVPPILAYRIAHRLDAIWDDMFNV